MTWHTTSQLAEGVFQISEPLGAVEPRIGVETVNMHLVIGRERAALIDSGMGVGDLAATVRQITPLACLLLNTHFHWDHIGANLQFEERAIHEIEAEWVSEDQDVGWVRQSMQRLVSAQAALPPGFDAAGYEVPGAPPTQLLRDDQEIDLGGRVLRTLHTPGHSPGHVAFLDAANGLLFSGDVAFNGPLFACLRGSDPDQLLASVQRLAALDGVKLVFPGHNETISEAGWLLKVAANVEAAVSGQSEGVWRETFVRGWEHDFGQMSVWLP